MGLGLLRRGADLHDPPALSQATASPDLNRRYSNHVNSVNTCHPAAANALRRRAELNARLPRFTRGFLSWLTGCPLPGTEPLVITSAARTLASAWLALALGAWIAVWSLSMGSLLRTVLGLACGWVLIVHGTRTVLVETNHDAVHGVLCKRSWLACAVVNLHALALVLQPFDGYRKDHVVLHHALATLATTADPDAKFLLSLGFERGMTPSELRRRLLRTLISPMFHYVFLRARLASNLTAGRAHAVAFLVYWAVMVSLSVASGHIVAFAIGIILPLVVLVQASALAQFAGEHPWLTDDGADQRARVRLGRRCVIRWLLPSVPPRGLPIRQAALSWFAFVADLAWAAFLRFTVLVGGLPAHGHHHRHPLTPSWRANHEVVDEIAAGDMKGFGPYAITTSFSEAIDVGLSGFATAAPAAEHDGSAKVPLDM